MRLRLFHRDDLTNQIDSRTLDEGELSIGRDARADWTVADPERGISRNHLTIVCRNGSVTVRDTSANGVFLGEPRQRIERDRPVPVGPGESIHFGHFVLMVEDGASDRRTGIDPIPPAAVERGSPFGAPAGLEAPHPEPRHRRLDPFGSALRPDPLVGGEHRPRDDGDSDVWERRSDGRRDDWNAAAANRRPDPPKIGGDREWVVPPAEPADAGYGFDAPFSSPILHQPAVSARATEIPSDWDMVEPAAADVAPPPAPPPGIAASPVAIPPDPAPAPRTPTPPPTPAGPTPAGDDTLFDAFCAGAGLSPTAFAMEDRAAVMERLGQVYRQAILGLADVMGERTALKDAYRMSRTAVRPEANNPFRWVPPQRIAVDLLRTDDSGYTTGAPAVRDAFHEVKSHLLCMLAGMRAALGATFDILGPDDIERRIAGRNYLIRAQRDAAAWTEYAERHAAVRHEAEDSSEGAINAAFRSAYERQLEEIRVYGPRR
ncbi:MAG TPA: type VI secretion system-associated FHA domain protein TagH [Sphingomonas sp.]|jgi:type VI secretion system protein ImpI/type VI secretion system protein|uniref:type VI secretion system-associated FHA domain protein TagH n=1 Tax=Sphingomonas sp. TaxID=28214 RepID=UPI002ED7E63A